MKNTKILFVLLLSIALFSCNSKPKSNSGSAAQNSATEANDTFKVQTNYHPDGKTVKETIEIIKIKKDGKDVWVRNGKTTTFYKDGNVQAESIYVMGKRDGIDKQYYEDGKRIYFLRPYKNSKKDGVVQKFYRSGNIMSETPYKQNMLGTGSQDYADKKVEDPKDAQLTMPELKVWAEDSRREKGTYIVYAKVVDKYDKTVSKVEFKDGMLLQADGRKYEHPGLKTLTEKNNIAKITYYESTGFPQYVSISARVVTNKGTALLLNQVHTVKD